MCGIAGIFGKNQDLDINENLLWSLINRIKHRGPDYQNIWKTKGVGLAHARLSIIDLDNRSNQPMIDLQTGRVIVFNGEIYNYIELKEILTKVGYQFTTQSDTEVILKSYDYWGIDCLNHFNGMWAFAIYDPNKKQLFSARDRFGVKPFIYGIDKYNNLVFASEPKAILNDFNEFKKPNIPFLTDFLEGDYFACYQETFYKGLFNLLPGHYFLVSHGELPQQKRYWQWKPVQLTPLPSHHDIIERFGALLEDSIKLRLRTDVPYGSCLSGGLDSSTLVGLATKLSGKPLSTFSCVYSGLPDFDESNYIDMIIQQYNSKSFFTTPKHDDFIKTIYDCTYEQDGPTGGPSLLSQRAVMQLAKGNVRVLLDGQGADEVLGGYHGYFYHSLLTFIRNNPKLNVFNAWSNYKKKYKIVEERIGKQKWNFFRMWLKANSQIKFGKNNDKLQQLDYFTPVKDDDLNTILLEHTFSNLPDLLHYEDRNSMLYSLETRLPFLDYKLVEYAFSLNHEYKIKDNITKWLLYQVASKVLPESVLNRKDKMGFTTPAHLWMQDEINLNYFEKYFNHQNLFYSELSNSYRTRLDNTWASIQGYPCVNINDKGQLNFLWRFITANIWLESLV